MPPIKRWLQLGVGVLMIALLYFSLMWIGRFGTHGEMNLHILAIQAIALGVIGFLGVCVIRWLEK